MNSKLNCKRHTIQGVLHLLRYGQYLLASMKTLKVLVSRIANVAVRILLNLLVEMIYGVSHDLQQPSVSFN